MSQYLSAEQLRELQKVLIINLVEGKTEEVQHDYSYYVEMFISAKILEGIIQDLGVRSGVKDCHPHKFRAPTATRAIDKGMPIEHNSIAILPILKNCIIFDTSHR